MDILSLVERRWLSNEVVFQCSVLKAIKDLILVTIDNDMHLLVLSTFSTARRINGCLERIERKYNVCGGWGWVGAVLVNVGLNTEVIFCHHCQKVTCETEFIRTNFTNKEKSKRTHASPA